MNIGGDRAVHPCPAEQAPPTCELNTERSLETRNRGLGGKVVDAPPGQWGLCLASWEACVESSLTVSTHLCAMVSPPGLTATLPPELPPGPVKAQPREPSKWLSAGPLVPPGNSGPGGHGGLPVERLQPTDE